MKKLLSIGAALTALIGTPALAADMALKAPPPPAPVYSWTGWYAGVNIGGSFGRAADTSTYGAPSVPFTSTSSNLDGVIGGGQIGYNWQVNNNWVLGLEADIQGSSERGTATSSAGVAGFCGVLPSFHARPPVPLSTRKSCPGSARFADGSASWQVPLGCSTPPAVYEAKIAALERMGRSASPRNRVSRVAKSAGPGVRP